MWCPEQIMFASTCLFRLWMRGLLTSFCTPHSLVSQNFASTQCRGTQMWRIVSVQLRVRIQKCYLISSTTTICFWGRLRRVSFWSSPKLLSTWPTTKTSSSQVSSFVTLWACWWVITTSSLLSSCPIKQKLSKNLKIFLSKIKPSRKHWCVKTILESVQSYHSLSLLASLFLTWTELFT